MENIDRGKAYKFFILLLSIVLAIVIFAKKESQEKLLSLFSRNNRSDIRVSREKTINLEGIKDAIAYDDVIVAHTGDSLVGYSFDGNEIWKKDIVLKNYSLYFGDTGVYICDKPTGYIQFVNTSGEIFKEINLEEEIKGLKQDYDNIIVCTVKDNNEKVYIIDKNINIKEINDLEIKNILSYSVSKDYTSYGISNLNLDSKDMGSRFTAFKYGKEVLYRKDFNNEMILYTKFLDTHRVVVMTDKNLYLLNDFEGNTLWKKPYELIKDIDVRDNKINILYGNTMETLSANGHLDSKYSFLEDYSRIVSFDKFILAYGKNHIMLVKDGKEAYKEELKGEVKKIRASKNRFIVIYDNKIDVYKTLD